METHIILLQKATILTKCTLALLLFIQFEVLLRNTNQRYIIKIVRDKVLYKLLDIQSIELKSQTNFFRHNM